MTAASISASNEAVFPRHFGAYVLVTHLGEGGMGRVYAALSPKGQLCVVKRFGNPRAPLPAHLLEQNKIRFRREAEITKALRHPCIARTYASVHEGEHSYLIQEFVSGMTLDDFMGALGTAGQHLPIALATYIVAQIAGALTYLHDFKGLGLIHRDLTATNVMFSRTGDVKVIDFGIAKATLADESLTEPHIVVGKPLWTAPEVCQGRKPDRRTDLYALGLLYWYLLSGEDPTDHLGRDKTRPHLPAPSLYRADIPREIDGLVLQAVHVRPDRRFQNADAFHRAIAHFLPKPYDGRSELAVRVRQHQLTSQDELFAALVSQARVLLAHRPPGGALRRRRWAAVAVSSVVLVSVGAFLATDPGPGQDRPPDQVLARESPLPSELDMSSSAAKEDVASPRPLRVRPPSAPLAPVPHRSALASPTPAARRSRPRPSHSASAVPRASLPGKTETSPTREPRSKGPGSADPEALLASADDAAATGDNAKALRLARSAVSLQPSAEAYLMVARLSWSDKSAARSALESALRLSPDNAQAARLLRVIEGPDPAER